MSFAVPSSFGKRGVPIINSETAGQVFDAPLPTRGSDLEVWLGRPGVTDPGTSLTAR